MRERPRAALAWSLVVECMLLIGFLVSCLAGMPFRGPDAPDAIIALMFGMTAMGAQSAIVRLLMRGMPSTNVMTTNTTMLAINAATARMYRASQSRSNRGLECRLHASSSRVRRATPAGARFAGGNCARSRRLHYCWVALRITGGSAGRQYGGVVHASPVGPGHGGHHRRPDFRHLHFPTFATISGGTSGRAYDQRQTKRFSLNVHLWVGDLCHLGQAAV
jgi:hypothetical protein